LRDFGLVFVEVYLMACVGAKITRLVVSDGRPLFEADEDA